MCAVLRPDSNTLCPQHWKSGRASRGRSFLKLEQMLLEREARHLPGLPSAIPFSPRGYSILEDKGHR